MWAGIFMMCAGPWALRHTRVTRAESLAAGLAEGDADAPAL